MGQDNKAKNLNHPRQRHDDFDDHTMVFRENTISVYQTPPAITLIKGDLDHKLGQIWLLEGNPIVGRHSNHSTICIEHKSISRKHAQFFLNKGQTQIQDLGSTNSTSVNKKKIKSHKMHPLEDGDIIKMGNLTFKFTKPNHPEILSAMKVRDQIYQDSLCQIHNRKFIENKGPGIFENHKKSRRPLSLIIFDIDHFKKINDSQGHPAGDFILLQIALKIKKLIRNADYFFRIGGEEFGVMMTGKQSQAHTLAEKIRISIGEQVFNFNQKNILVTVSLGLTILKKEDQSWKDLYKRADEACYKSKQNGRNQVFIL